MHHRVSGPPAVCCAIHRTPRLKLLLLALWLPGGALLVAMLAFGDASRNWLLVLSMLAALSLSAFGLGVFWRRQRDGILDWDGTHWRLDRRVAGASPVGLCRVDVHLDLQAALLLRWQAAESFQSGWTWVERKDAPECWHLLRCALNGAFRSDAEGLQGATAVERT